MRWTSLRQGALLGIDWSQQLGKPLDPYLVWADATSFKGLASAASSSPAAPPALLRLALELVDDKMPNFDGAKPNMIVDRPGQRFATIAIEPGRVSELLNCAAVRRLELGFAGLTTQIGDQTRGRPDKRRIDRPVVAVIDFGCAFAHERFRHCQENRWRTRIAYLWDQGRPASGRWNAVDDFGYGRELHGADIDALIADNTDANAHVDESGVYLSANYNDAAKVLTHGTHVLDLAAGAPADSDPALAPEIIFVQLPSTVVDDTSGGSMVTHVMDALAYILDRVDPLAPVVVNLSYGSMAGPHDGSTILESTIDAVIEQAMGLLPTHRPSRYLSVVLPAGNNFESDGHAVLALDSKHPTRSLEWQVLAEDTTDTFLELWYPRRDADRVVVRVQPPGGPSHVLSVGEMYTLVEDDCVEPIAAALHLRRASSGNDDATVLVALAPTASPTSHRRVAPSGTWRITVSLTDDAGGPVEIHAWVERDDPPIGSGAPPRQSRLLTGALPLPANSFGVRAMQVRRCGTGSSIANGTRSVVVGACVDRADGIEFAPYTSAGPSRNLQRHFWPDVAAVSDTSHRLRGVPAAGTRSGVSARMNGTSVAAPLVARALIEAFLPYQSPTNGCPMPPTHGLGDRIAKPSQTDQCGRAGRGLIASSFGR